MSRSVTMPTSLPPTVTPTDPIPTVHIVRAASAHDAVRSSDTTSRTILFPMQAIWSSSVESELRDRTDARHHARARRGAIHASSDAP
jgi:hypothetical protein